MKAPSFEKVSPQYSTGAGRVKRKMLVLAATCRTHRLCNPPSSSAVATYLPSGEIAAVTMLPEAVNWLTRIVRKALCVSSEGAFDLKYSRKPRTAPRIKRPKPNVTPRRVFKLH